MLTETQDEIYQFIKHYILSNGYAPTEATILKRHPQLTSHRAVREALKALIGYGLLEKHANRRRNITLTDAHRLSFKQLPIIGKIAAGMPIEPLETDEVLDLGDLLLGPNRYVLQVIGDSMSGDNICDGDYIICERRETASDGAIVVAQVNDKETTLKRIKRNQDKTITLLSSNPDTTPLVYPANQVKIQGVYLGLIRLNQENN